MSLSNKRRKCPYNHIKSTNKDDASVFRKRLSALMCHCDYPSLLKIEVFF